MIVERCTGCPLNKLDEARHSSYTGRLLDAVLQLDFNAETFSVSFIEIEAEKIAGLQVLREERQFFQKEEMEQRDREREIRSTLERAQNRNRGW